MDTSTKVAIGQTKNFKFQDLVGGSGADPTTSVSWSFDTGANINATMSGTHNELIVITGLHAGNDAAIGVDGDGNTARLNVVVTDAEIVPA